MFQTQTLLMPKAPQACTFPRTTGAAESRGLLPEKASPHPPSQVCPQTHTRRPVWNRRLAPPGKAERHPRRARTAPPVPPLRLPPAVWADQGLPLRGATSSLPRAGARFLLSEPILCDTGLADTQGKCQEHLRHRAGRRSRVSMECHCRGQENEKLHSFNNPENSRTQVEPKAAFW